VIRLKEPLLQHSLWLIGATAVGHVGNYVYHVICGRMMPDAEYGLMMALFGGVNLILIPMAALGVTLTRAVRLSSHARLSDWLRQWSVRLAIVAAGMFVLAAVMAPAFQRRELSGRAAPLLLAAAIPALNLFLILTGSALQGIQAFRELSLRGSVLFVIRALLVGVCLTLGFRAAGWALLAHLLGMLTALAFSIWALKRLGGRAISSDTSSVTVHVADLGVALPVLLSFAVLMSADVVLVRTWLAEVSGPYAQAATLGRMILWLPLPVAQAMFPKVVRDHQTTSEHRNTALRAVGYTLLLVIPAFVVCWAGADLALRMMFGESSPEQVQWMRGIAVAMLPLAPLHVWIQYELARGKLLRLLPVLAGTGVYLTMSILHHETPDQIVRALQIATFTALLFCLVGLFVSKRQRA